MVKPSSPGPIAFDLRKEHVEALEAIAGGRRVRLSGAMVNGKLVVNFIACNAPFLACNAPFTACNAPFVAGGPERSEK
jgi:hypothetical protein